MSVRCLRSLEGAWEAEESMGELRSSRPPRQHLAAVFRARQSTAPGIKYSFFCLSPKWLCVGALLAVKGAGLSLSFIIFVVFLKLLRFQCWPSQLPSGTAAGMGM